MTNVYVCVCGRSREAGVHAVDAINGHPFDPYGDDPYRSPPRAKPQIYCWVSQKRMIRLDRVVSIWHGRQETYVFIDGGTKFSLDLEEAQRFEQAWNIYEEMTK